MIDVPGANTSQNINLWPMRDASTGAYVDEATYNGVLQSIRAQTDAYCISAKSAWVGDLSLAQQYGYSYSNEGEIGEPITERIDLKIDPVPHFPDFERRSAAGEIMVSNYYVGNVVGTSYPGREAGPIYNYSTSLIWEICPFVGFHWDGSLLINNRYYCPALSASSPWVGVQRSQTNTTIVPPVQLQTRQLAEGLLSGGFGGDIMSPLIDELVSRVLSFANKRSVDVLTAAAEIPETLKSLLSGFKMVIKAIRDLKKGKLTASKAFDHANQINSDRRSRAIVNLNRRLTLWTNQKGQVQARVLYEREMRRIERSYRKATKRTLLEFNSALADIWLNFRYGIMPNVYLAEDIERAVGRFGRLITRNGDRISVDVPCSIHDTTALVPTTVSCMIKRGFPDGQKLNVVASANIFTTAWELVPLSFVVDWFVNVGDMISNFTMPTCWDQEASTLSFRYDIDIDLVLDNQCRVKYTGSIYKRWVINPLDYMHWKFQLDMNWKRYLDSAALLWRPTRSALLQHANF